MPAYVGGYAGWTTHARQRFCGVQSPADSSQDVHDVS